MIQSKRNLFYCQPSLFTEEFCNLVKEVAERHELVDGLAVGDEKEKIKRRSSIKWLPLEGPIHSSITDFSISVNRHFNLDISCLEALQYTEYNSDVLGHFDIHSDVDWSGEHGWAFDRKLSISIQLSHPEEYEGGDFSFGAEKSTIILPEEAKKIGTVIAFPSWMIHKVSPVTKGIRKSLVSWVLGPQWR